MASDSELGAIGSIRIPACEVCPPAWFANCHSLCAVLTDRDLEEIRQPLEYLPGAGVCVRRKAWEQLIENGFRSHLTQGGEDVELTRALQLSGWKLRIEQRLRLRHFIPKYRLQWMYLRKLQRAYGASDVLLDAYSKHNLSLRRGLRRWLSDRWWYQLGKSITKIASKPGAAMAAVRSVGEGRDEILEIEQQFGRVLGLLRFTREYSDLRRLIRETTWRDRLDHSEACFDPNTGNTISIG